MKINVDTGVIMQKISFLLLGTSLSFLPQTLNAQCVSPIQDCYALGYTQTSCPNGKGVKCPFGNGWYCGGTAAQDCIKLGYNKDCTGAGESGSGQTCNGKYQSCTCDSTYKYTCSGTGYAGGSGSACGGKYTSCSCTSPYTWTSDTCSCPTKYKYTCTGTGYSGGSGAACNGKYTKCKCSSDYEWKNGICIKNPCLNTSDGAYNEVYCCNNSVVGVKTENMNFYIATKDLGTMTGTDAYSACSNYSFCNNIKGILPSSSELVSIYNNKSLINNLLSTHGGTKITESSYWSSTPFENSYLFVNMNTGQTTGYRGDNPPSLYTRPILASW